MSSMYAKTRRERYNNTSMQAATFRVKDRNQEVREMFLLNTEAVAVGFLKKVLREEGFDLNKEVPRSQHKKHMKELE